MTGAPAQVKAGSGGKPGAPDHVDEDVLRSRVAAAAQGWSATAQLESFEQVSGGSSSLTFQGVLRGEPGIQSCFVKVAPPGLAPVGNRDVLRQAALLTVLALEGTVAVPRVLFVDPGAPPAEPPFFASEAVAGEGVEPLIDAHAALPSAPVLSSRTYSATRMLAGLHNVDRDLVSGLAGQAGPPKDLEFDVQRWGRAFATVDPELADAARPCAERLLDRVPKAVAPTIVHGDFRLGNLMCVGGQVRAVLDWEIWSVADPRIDLAWFLMTLEPGGLPSAIRLSAPGLPTPEEVLAEYESARGVEVADLTWFSALSRYRAAAAMSLNVKHNRRRAQPDARIERYAALLPNFLAIAKDLLD